MTTKLSIVVPCYNEEKNLPALFSAFADAIKRNDIELIIVNNGSTDNSQKIINELLPQYTFARCHHVTENQGYGYGILAGLDQAQGEFLGWTHADLQTDPQDVLKALSIIEKNNNDQNYI